MKFSPGVTAMCLVCSTYAGTSEYLKEFPAKNEFRQYEREMNMEELPPKVQDSVRKVCEGKVVSIKEIMMNNTQYYRVVCEMDSTKTAYLFDSEGNHKINFYSHTP